MIEEVGHWIGLGDRVISTMGPIATIVLALFFGWAVTQTIKFPLAHLITEASDEYTYVVRMFGILVTIFFAHVLSDSLPWPMELGCGFAQPFAYFLCMKAIRRFVPWLEVSPLIGSVTPPKAAIEAAAQRQADKRIVSAVDAQHEADKSQVDATSAQRDADQSLLDAAKAQREADERHLND